MNAKLSEEQRRAIEQHPGQPVVVEDDQTNRFYVIVDQQTHQRAMRALQREEEDVAAIQAGLDAAAAGQISTLEEADRRIRQQVGFPPRE
jgi:predicted transcriptional regulator